MEDQKRFDLKIAHHGFLLWVIAFFITVGSAVFQRMTGPTYPLSGWVTIGNERIRYELIRSETVNSDAKISISAADTTISGIVEYRRYKSDDDWTKLVLERSNDRLETILPAQPAAGKLMYVVYLKKGEEKISLSGEKPIIIRYKGAVPTAILLPHILLMFLAMLLSNRAGLEALNKDGRAYRYLLWTVGIFFVGGFILGPLMQKYAFGAYWTGIPFGRDLTDNKTLIAMLGWIFAWFKNRKGRDGRGWIVFAALLMLLVYMIPHSLLGSEIDYSQLPQSQ
ncbi:MAG: hypothetical protein ABIL68_10430 [bacterium]